MYHALCHNLYTIVTKFDIQVGLVKNRAQGSFKMSYLGFIGAEILSSKISKKPDKSFDFYSIFTNFDIHIGIVGLHYQSKKKLKTLSFKTS